MHARHRLTTVMIHALCACLMSCVLSRRNAPAVVCPTIPAGRQPYPYVQYWTFVLDGRIIGVRIRQLNKGEHSVAAIDSNPAFDRIDFNRVAHYDVLTGDPARKYEPCPGVRVLMIRMVN